MEEREDLSPTPSGDGARMSQLPGAGTRDRCQLCLMGQALMTACSRLCMCDGRQAF